MIFIKRSFSATSLVRATLLVILTVAGGCQFSPEKADVAADKAADGQQQSLPRVRSANPYLENPPAVPSEARHRFAAAAEALARQQWEVAETDLLWLTENYPAFSGPYLNLAQLYLSSGQMDKVEPAFRQAISANGNNVSAYNQYAIYLRTQGRFADAEQNYLQALAVWPDSAESHLNLGILYDLYMGKLEQGLMEYRAYQDLQDEPDRQVQGWIVDAERRLSTQQRAGKAGGAGEE